MAIDRKRWPGTGQPEHTWIGWLLRAGLALGGALMAVGFVFALITDAWTSAAVPASWWSLPSQWPQALLHAGIVCLAMTPVLRVLALIGIWLHARDLRFAALGALVVAILVASILSGAG